MVHEWHCASLQINRGYRVQFSSAIGPYKGGLRFHPTVNTLRALSRVLDWLLVLWMRCSSESWMP